jgi:DNA-binding GntR family transcriptional regulator
MIRDDGARVYVCSGCAEVPLAERLRMSRTPVREALRRLESEGLVARSWRGLAVPVPDEAEIGHVYELRAALEALSAEHAARSVRLGNVSPAELGALRELAVQADKETSQGELDHAIATNRRFHRHIATMAANPVLVGVLDRLWDRLIISTRVSLRPPDRRDAVASEHESLIAAIEEGEPERAFGIARAHVRSTRAALEGPR